MWDMAGEKAVFTTPGNRFHLELPQQTILEVEVVDEFTGEVRYSLHFLNCNIVACIVIVF